MDVSDNQLQSQQKKQWNNTVNRWILNSLSSQSFCKYWGRRFLRGMHINWRGVHIRAGVLGCHLRGVTVWGVFSGGLISRGYSPRTTRIQGPWNGVAVLLNKFCHQHNIYISYSVPAVLNSTTTIDKSQSTYQPAYLILRSPSIETIPKTTLTVFMIVWRR